MNLREQLQSTLGTSYTLERELGGGGMSRVFVADETRLNRKVVVKVLTPELAQGISAERFEREIQLAASLQQANIVPILNAGESDGVPYYTMPFVEGESLRAYLRTSGAMPIALSVSVLRDVARALAYAHERGIVHRDIKPDNVLLSGGAAVVTDFGIAKAISASRTQSGDGATLTQMGTSIGTPAYISPEQAAGDPNVDQRADIYSFGCMAYEMLSGQPPFTNRTPQRLMAAHMGEKPQPVTELRPDLSPMLASLVMRCLEKDAALRPQSASELLATLDTPSTSDAGHVQMPAILLGGRGMLRKALTVYAAAFVVVAIIAKAAIVGIGLPDWVFPGALVVMALGLPVILLTAYAQYVARRSVTASPTFTPGGSPSLQHGTMATFAMKASPHLSWRRATMGGVYAVGGFVALIGAFMLLRVLGIGPAGSLLAAGRLAARDRVLVTDFTVKGADSSLSSVVTEAVRTELGQSDVISIVSPATVAAALRRMQRAPTSRVDLTTGREIAQREGAKAVVDGDVATLASGFVVSLRLVTADSGAVLASFHETADGLKELLPTLDKLIRSLRGKMGESLKSVRADPPLEQYTTASLDALRKLADARRANNIEGDFAKSAALLEQAVALDTAFAMAYRSLGIAYGNLGVSRDKQDSAYAKAYRFRDRLTERERYLATANYFGGPARDRAREIAAYEEYIVRYPHDYTILNNLALRYDSRRTWARAESVYRRGIAEAPDATLQYGNLLRNLVSQSHFSDASAVEADVRRRFPSGPVAEGVTGQIDVGKGLFDSAAAKMSAARASTRNPQSRARFTAILGSIALLDGRHAQAARNRHEQAVENAARGAAGSPLDEVLQAATIDVWFRDQPARAIASLDSLLAHTPLRTLPVDQRSDFQIATIYALAHRPDRARAVIAQYETDVRDTTVRRSQEPGRHAALAEIAIAEGRPRDAVDEVRQSDRLPDGPPDACQPCADAAMGRVFDLAGMPDSAIVAFERYTATTFWNRLNVRADPIHLAAAYKRLGELYEAKGDKQRAASNYAKFVDLWKNADAELQPKVAEVKQRLAHLGDTEKR